jgi:sugar lactone lactonase YvrE
VRKILAWALAAFLVLAAATPAAASTRVIVLPGAASAEGITAGRGSTFYAGELFDGDIYRGDLRRGTAELFIDAPDGSAALGMDTDLRHDLLYVAAGEGGIRVYDTRTGSLVAEYDTGDVTMVNDVTVTPYGAWFTDSLQPRLYFLPRGVPGRLRTRELSGPAAGASGVFHLNGITSTPSGATLLVAPQGQLCTIDPLTGVSEPVAGVVAPGADGLVLDGRRLWVVEAFTGQAFANRVTRWQLSADLSSGTADGVITDPAFGVPVTAARFGNSLAVMNSHLDTGFPPNRTSGIH